MWRPRRVSSMRAAILQTSAVVANWEGEPGQGNERRGVCTAFVAHFLRDPGCEEGTATFHVPGRCKFVSLGVPAKSAVIAGQHAATRQMHRLAAMASPEDHGPGGTLIEIVAET